MYLMYGIRIPDFRGPEEAEFRRFAGLPGGGPVFLPFRYPGGYQADYAKSSDNRKTGRKNIHHRAARPAHKGGP
jgi:hypothetical protein